MNFTKRSGAALVATLMLLGGCATTGSGGSWQTLIDGAKGLDNFKAVGDANWRAEGGAIVADKGKGGFLVSKQTYRDVEIKAEFWADDTTNSGIFVRASDPGTITATNAYEVNIYDRRPDPTYATGGIVDVAKVKGVYKAAGKWNTMVITAKGDQFVIVLNGVETSRGSDAKHPQGPIALQFGAGPEGSPLGSIKWRKVQVRSL
jgi:hypothetical protein